MKEYSMSPQEARLNEVEQALNEATDEREELLDTLEGCEVLSPHFEGCVMVVDGRIIQDGEIIREEPTLEELRTLMREEFAYEFGRRSVQEVLEDEGPVSAVGLDVDLR